MDSIRRATGIDGRRPTDSLAAPLRAALRAKSLAGRPGGPQIATLASGEGWRVLDIVCTSGPRDVAFEERHSEMAISLVLAGAFTYRGRYGRSLLTPGALLLGELNRCFECGHEHCEGDRCLSFHYGLELFERLAVDAGARRTEFGRSTLGPTPSFSPLVSRALATLFEQGDFESLAYGLAVHTMRACHDAPPPVSVGRDDTRRISDVVKLVEERLNEPMSIAAMAATVGISPYRLLHLFKRVTRVSPHQYRQRLRLRSAAVRLRLTRDSVTEIGLTSGFDDVSNFTRTFKREFGLSPSQYRLAADVS